MRRCFGGCVFFLLAAILVSGCGKEIPQGTPGPVLNIKSLPDYWNGKNPIGLLFAQVDGAIHGCTVSLLENGYVITAGHCVSTDGSSHHPVHAMTLFFQNPGDTQSKGYTVRSIIAFDFSGTGTSDWAILLPHSRAELPQHYHGIKLAQNYDFKDTAQDVPVEAVVYNPSANNRDIHAATLESKKGRMMSVEHFGGTSPMTMLNMIPGNSGGPVFHSLSHELVGIVSTANFDEQHRPKGSTGQWAPHVQLLKAVHTLMENFPLMKFLIRNGPLRPSGHS